MGMVMTPAVRKLSLTVHVTAAAALAIYKPEGRIGAVSAPRWARAFGFILGGVVLLIALMAIFGAHGPGAH